LSFHIANEWGELIVVSDKDKFIGIAKWAETGGEGDLRSFVNDTVIEFSFIKDETGVSTSKRLGRYWFMPRQVVATTRGEW
jgi:hypothetical protein